MTHKVSFFSLTGFACAFLVISNIATAFDSDAHMDLARAADYRPMFQLPQHAILQCREAFVRGTHAPDRRHLLRGRHPLNNPSHQRHAEFRSDRSFCAAVNSFRQALVSNNAAHQCEALHSLGAALHYLQDWADPSKEIDDERIPPASPCRLPNGLNPSLDRPPTGSFTDYVRQSVSCVVRNNPEGVARYAAQYRQTIAGKSHQEILAWLHARRKYTGEVLGQYKKGKPDWDNGYNWGDSLLRTAAAIVAAENEFIRSFVNYYHSGLECRTDDLDETVIANVEGRGRVRSRNVRICVVDSNSILDDHYDLYVNRRLLGPVHNQKGGSTCYQDMLHSGDNLVYLKLTEKMGKNTKLTININDGEFSAGFSGSHHHSWAVNAP